MGHFHFNTVNTWDVGLHHGHSAFRLLRLVCDIEKEYTVALNSEEDGSVKVSGKPDITALHWSLSKDMFRLSSASVMMFQAMMEALINDALEREARLAGISQGGAFAQKWRTSLQVLGQEVAPFDNYHSQVYKKFRIPMVHPKKVKMTDFDDLSFSVLRSGYEFGWRAYVGLYEGLGHPHDPDSWTTMCRAHDIPLDVE